MSVSSSYGKYVIALIISIAFGWAFASSGVKLSLVFLLSPPLIPFLIYAFDKPTVLLYGVLILAFLISLLSRYIPGIPFGLSVDAIFFLIAIILIFDQRVSLVKDHFSNPLALALIGWIVFTFVEIANPIAPSKMAWLYANRGLSFYPFFLVVLTPYLLKSENHVRVFLIIWASLSVLGTVWGMKQLFIGVSEVERAWLNAGAASTHILFGKLRVFSYFSDAAQFGANQAHTALVFGILALFSGKFKYRLLVLAISVLSLYGMLISGTRGALAILAAGGFAYFVMTKNFRVVIAGLVFAFCAFGFLKYTTLLQSNYQINRLRSALDTDDPSLRVRFEREARLENYMSDKPIGGGIGSAGYWGKRFSPGTFLAELGTDGHYTRIWMETGKIGLYLYYLMLAVIALYLGKLLWNMPASFMRQILVAFYCGFIGICFASYTNGLLTQLPTGPLVFVGLALIVSRSKTT
ncbi:MAG: O-antigen ligase domain-containing protein [Cyclobacteriaceae bacterium]